MKTKKSSASRLPAGFITRHYVRFRDDGLRYAVVWARTRDQSIKEVRARHPHLLASDILGSATEDRKPNLSGYKHSGEFEAGTHRRSNPRAAEMDMPAPRRLRHHTIKVIATGLPADAKVMHGGHNIIHDPLPDGSPARRSGGRTMFGLDYAPRVSQAVVVVAGRNRLTFDIDPRRITEDPVDGSSVFVIPMDFGMVRPNPAVACSPNKKRDRYRAAKVMHQGEWVQNDGCWDAKGVPSYVGKGESGKRRVIAKKAVRQKASRTPSRVKGVRARKRS